MNKYLEKIAATAQKPAKKEDIRPHQSEALKQLDKEDGVILDHSTGSGKTKTFLMAIAKAQKDHPNENALLVAPASLISNVHKEIKKHGIKIDESKLTAMSYEMAANRASELRKKKYSITVADEGHKLRNTNTKRSQELSDILMAGRKRVIATATPTFNHASDIAPLINIVAGGKVMPTGKKDFEQRYVQTKIEKDHFYKRVLGINKDDKEVKSIKNKGELKDIMQRYVHHYDLTEDPQAKKDFPTSSTKIVEVPMSATQETMYKYLESKVPFYTRMKIRMGMPLDKKESSNLNAFSTGMRQVSNSTRPYMPNHKEVSPKIRKAVDSLLEQRSKDKNFRAFVHSSYLKAGIEEYAEELAKAKVKHAVYHGGLSAKQKDAIVKDYNEGKIQAILASDSGSEGLDLKGTKLIQVLGPAWNHSKTEQVEGRGVRYKSHAHLPENERHVNIEKYHSVFAKGFMGKSKGTSIDTYLHNMGGEKSDLGEQVRQLSKKD